VFLSVGQGDCTLIRHAGAVILVDAGPGDENFDAGSRIIAPKLRSRGVGAVSLLLLTHPDADHIGGLPGLMQFIRIGQIAAPEHFKGHPELMEVFRRANVDIASVLWLERPLAMTHEGMRLDVRLPKYIEGDADNDGSPFVKVELQGMTAVLTGDAGEEVEAMQAVESEWHAQILKAGHHGSAGSTSDVWLAEVKPEAVVASCGLGNRFGHPAEAVVERVRLHGARLFRTDLQGDIAFTPATGGFRVSAQR
jgi:competence protein ComEC